MKEDTGERCGSKVRFDWQLLRPWLSVLSGTHGVAAAVDGQVDASDEAGGVGRQEGDALGHLVHLARSAQRVGLLTLGKELHRGGGWG